MKVYTKVADIRKAIKTLRASSVPGISNDGKRIMVRYEAFGQADEKARIDARPARTAGLDLRIYTGILDKVFETKDRNPHLCFTMLVLERLDSAKGEYGFRTFNLNKGRLRWLKVL